MTIYTKNYLRTLKESDSEFFHELINEDGEAYHVAVQFGFSMNHWNLAKLEFFPLITKSFKKLSEL